MTVRKKSHAGAVECLKLSPACETRCCRGADAQDEERIHQWCLRHGLPKLEVTNRKDYGMIALWDELAVGVVRNIGVPILPVQMTFWQSLRLQLLLLVGRNAVMKVDTRNVQDQFEAPQKNGRKFFKFDG